MIGSCHVILIINDLPGETEKNHESNTSIVDQINSRVTNFNHFRTTNEISRNNSTNLSQHYMVS